MSGRAQMTLSFTSITGEDGRKHAMDAVPLVLQAESGTGLEPGQKLSITFMSPMSFQVASRN